MGFPIAQWCQGSYYDQIFTIIFFENYSLFANVLLLPYGSSIIIVKWQQKEGVIKDVVMHLWEEPLILFTIIGKDQVVMGNWTIGISCAYRERPDGDGKDTCIFRKDH